MQKVFATTLDNTSRFHSSCGELIKRGSKKRCRKTAHALTGTAERNLKWRGGGGGGGAKKI